jgi:nicotinamidase-related amidase
MSVTEHSTLSEAEHDAHPVAVLLIDVINTMDFPGAELIYDAALAAAPNIATLKRRAKERGIPVIYANDNFGRWRSNFPSLVDSCLREGVPGRPLVEQLKPDKDDYFVLKPSYSAFYGTPLELLLRALRARSLVLAGFAGNMCVQFSAEEAFMRGYRIAIPRDCTASNHAEDTDCMLHHVQTVLGADTRPATELCFEEL